MVGGCSFAGLVPVCRRSVTCHGAVEGVQAIKVGALSSQTADVTIFFPGNVNDLQAALAAQGLNLSGGGGDALVLRSN